MLSNFGTNMLSTTDMAKLNPKDVGNLFIDLFTISSAVSGGSRSFRLWTSLSASAFRRKILNAMRCGGGSFHRHCSGDTSVIDASVLEPGKSKTNWTNARSEKLSDFLNLSDSPEKDAIAEELEGKGELKTFEEFRGAVKLFQSREMAERKEGAMRVRRLAKVNMGARSTLAMLGAVPPLVGMLSSEDSEIVTESLYALLNLGIGNDVNKAAIVKAGAIHKMLFLIESSNGYPDVAIAEAIVGNFLSLSALDSNKPVIGSSGAIPFMVRILKNPDKNSGVQAKQDVLRALYNLSICHSNVPQLLETQLIPFLLDSLGDMEFSERILMILSNVVSTPEGRRGITRVPEAFPILIDVLNWNDSPMCQEKACYVLMVMAHKAYGDRQAMIEAGIVSQLLELTLVGSALAQKRASRILECLRISKGKQVCDGHVSAPISGSSSSSSANHPQGLKEDENTMSDERKAVKELVQQSLQSNMKRIVKRANLPQDFVPSEHLKSLTQTSTSKSLPF